MRVPTSKTFRPPVPFPSKPVLLLQPLARCLIDPTIDSRPGYNAAPLATPPLKLLARSARRRVLRRSRRRTQTSVGRKSRDRVDLEDDVYCWLLVTHNLEARRSFPSEHAQSHRSWLGWKSRGRMDNAVPYKTPIGAVARVLFVWILLFARRRRGRRGLL